MSELQAYYDNFRTGYWATESAEDCPCHGRGYALSEVDTWHKCPVHHAGQLSPEDLDGLYESGASEEVIEAAAAVAKAEWELTKATRKVEAAKHEVHRAEYGVKAAKAALAKVVGEPETAAPEAAAEVAAEEGSDEDIPF